MADEMISKETCKDGWRTLTVDLSKFAGTEMKLGWAVADTLIYPAS